MPLLSDFIGRIHRWPAKKSWLVFGVLIFIVLLLLQGSAINDQFLSDDYDWVRNARIRVGDGDWLNAFQTPTGGNFFRPLVAFSFEIDYSLWGYETFGYHLHQIIFHTALILAIAALCWTISSNKTLALGTGLLFALYPSHHEVITWIAGRPDLYAATFGVISVTAFLSFLKKRAWWKYVLACVAAACAFLSKEIAFVLPGLILLGIPFVIPIRQWKRIAIALLWLIPFAAILGTILYWRSTILSDAIGGYLVAGDRKGLDFQSLNLNKVFTSVVYLVNWEYATTVFGNTWFVHWGKRLFEALQFHWELVLGIIVVALSAFFGRKNNRPRLPLFLFGFFWALFSFIPVFGLSGFIAPNLTASRLFFSSSVGYAIMLSALLLPFPESSHFKKTRTVIFSFVLLLFCSLWIFNYLPWNTASNNVAKIKTALASQQQEILKDSPTHVFVGRLPGLYNGAYEFFGIHSIRESMYEVTKNASIDTFLIGNRPYTNSPLCLPRNKRTIAFINWNEDKGVFVSGSPSVERMLNDKKRTAPEPMEWDFSDPVIASSWTFEGIEQTQESNGLRLTIPSGGNRYLQSPGFDEVFLGDYTSATLTFSILDTASDFGQYQASFSWAVRGSYNGSNAFNQPFKKNKKITAEIPTCQYLNWSLTNYVNQLRIRPIQSGTILLESLTLK